MPRALSVLVGDDKTHARLYAVKNPSARLILGHGAGSDQDHPLMVGTAQALAALGLEVVTFNFLYSEAGRGMPDRAPKLEACWRAVLAKFSTGAVFIGGRSMGGRIASHIAAEGADGVRGLVFIGYPLHPPDKPEQRRDAHLPSIRQPMLFVHGERDPFGTPREMKTLMAGLPSAELHLVAGAEHSLKVGKRAQADVDAAVQQKIAAWVKAH